MAGSNKRGLSLNVQDYWDEYYKSVGMQGDNLDFLVSSASGKGINIVSGFQAAFDPMTGNIQLASNSKI